MDVQASLEQAGGVDEWLEERLWPVIRDSVLDHNAFDCAASNATTPFPTPREFHGDYVGRVGDDAYDSDSDYVRNGLDMFSKRMVDARCRLRPEHIFG